MICKWCGAEMSRKETQCRRCGREAPVLSDCGGFYDLVPQAPRPIPAAAVGASGAQAKRKASPFAAILCVLLAAALVVSVMAGLRMNEEMEELEDRLAKTEDLEELQNGAPEDDQTATPDQQEMAVIVNADSAAEALTVSAQSTEGAQMKLDYESGKDGKYGIQLAVDEVIAALEVDHDDGEGNLSVECTLDDAFGEEKNAFHLESVLVTGKDGQKLNLIQDSSETEEETVPEENGEAVEEETKDTQEQNGDGPAAEKLPWSVQEDNSATWKIPHAYLQWLLNNGELEENTPLELVFVRTSRQGGSFTFTLSGLVVPEE